MDHFVLYNRANEEFYGSRFLTGLPKFFSSWETVTEELEKIKRKNESARNAAKAVKSGHIPEVFSHEQWEVLKVTKEGIQRVA